MKDTMMTMMKKAETRELINSLAKKCTLNKAVHKNKVIDTDGVPFVFIDNDGDEKIFNQIGFSSTKIMKEPSRSIGRISNKITDIIKASKYIPFHQNNIMSTMDINDTRIISNGYSCDEDNF